MPKSKRILTFDLAYHQSGQPLTYVQFTVHNDKKAIATIVHYPLGHHEVIVSGNLLDPFTTAVSVHTRIMLNPILS